MANAEETKSLNFFYSVYRAFEEAEQSQGDRINYYFKIGRQTVLLRFAGPSLVPFITPALEHLSTSPISAPVLTICLWDSVSTKIKMPARPWSTDDYIPRGEVRGYSNDRIHVAFHIGLSVLSMLDTRADLAIFWIRDACEFPPSESATPMRTIFYWWMRDRGQQLVHAASIGTKNGGVLLAGKGGSGKSTTALACLLNRMLYAGDDHILISQKPIPFVTSLYNSVKLDTNFLQKFPNLSMIDADPRKQIAEKTIFFLYKYYPERMATGFPLRAILIPHLTGLPESKLSQASPAAALKALAPSTVFMLSGAGVKDFQEITRLVSRIPGYTLELGTELRDVPNLVKSLLAEQCT